MADAKVSELTAATSVAASDLLYVVDGTDSKKLTIENLFASVPTAVAFNEKVSIQNSETVTATTTSISNTSNVTYLSDWAQSGNATILAGTDGQIKIIVMSSNASGATVTITGTRHPQDVVFSQAGDSATFIYNSTTSKWYFIGGSATVS